MTRTGRDMRSDGAPLPRLAQWLFAAAIAGSALAVGTVHTELGADLAGSDGDAGGGASSRRSSSPVT